MEKLIKIKIKKETLIKLNRLLKENPLLIQGNNDYSLLLKVLIEKYLKNLEVLDKEN